MLVSNCYSLRKGYSFIEVMLAMLIIGIIAAFLATSVPSALVTGEEVNDLSRATSLAQRYMETIKSDLSYTTNYDGVIAGTDSPITVSSDFTDNGYFTVNTNVTDLETDTINGSVIPVLKKIDVEYIKVSDSQSLISISTLISRPE